MILREFENKSKGIGADLAGTAGGRDALAARTSHAQHTFTQTTQIHKDNRLVLAKNAVLVEYRYFQTDSFSNLREINRNSLWNPMEI